MFPLHKFLLSNLKTFLLFSSLEPAAKNQQLIGVHL